jgi:hypothetical protein
LKYSERGFSKRRVLNTHHQGGYLESIVSRGGVENR